MSRLPEYRDKLQHIEASLARARSVQRLTFIGAAGLLVLSILAVANRAPVWCRLLPLALIAIAGRKFVTNRAEWLRRGRVQRFYEDGAARMEGGFAGCGFSGDEFHVHGHPFESELNLFGTGSLFELLCTARTEIGRARLASFLLDPATIEESKARQDAVRELAPATALREEIVLLGKYAFRESSVETFSRWLDSPPIVAPAPVRLAALLSSLALLTLIFWTYFAAPLTLASWQHAAPWIGGCLAINAVIAAVWYRRMRGAVIAAKQMGMEIGLLREGIELLQGRKFDSLKLRALTEELSKENAAQAVRRLERMTNALHHCDKAAFDLPARALIARLQLAFGIERWKLRHGPSLGRWMNAWAEFEALVALSGYAYEHPSDAFPEFTEGGARFEARALGHPLLPRETCVGNDLALGAERRFIIISGSNMAGKSTVLRAIGMNVVLAYAGAPVRAESMNLSQLSLCASLAVVDSVLEGKSKFLAEVDKLRQMLELARGPDRILFLIDEIFAGTNSGDRRIAAEAVVKSLVAEGAIGALSTHDLALTELNGENVHMGSRQGSNDPMDFDYLLKPGVTRESNALAIAKMAGVLD